MRETGISTEGHGEPELIEIRIKGHLDKRWAGWFDGLTITLRRERRDPAHRPRDRSGGVAQLAAESA